MSNQFIDIEAFAQLAGISVNTIRRKLKTLSETDKIAFVRHIPVVGRGGQKIMLDKALINQWKTMSNQEMTQNDIDNSLGNQEKETIQEQIKEPEYDNAIIEILKGQIERLEKQTDIKDAQISDLSHTNKELLERLKEVNYTLANAQKQLAQPVDDDKIDTARWWQFWK